MYSVLGKPTSFSSSKRFMQDIASLALFTFCGIFQQVIFMLQKDYEPQNLLLYYDDPDQWPAVYNTDKVCNPYIIFY